VYEKFGARLLEANVRSFLSATGKVNLGIRNTLRDDPERFMAYNNGIVVIADEIRLGKTSDGSPGIAWLKGMQVVNGGQTTASIYFAKKKPPGVDLGRVRVPAKVIVLKSADAPAEEDMISAISRFANSQNVVRQADLSANKPYHVEVEKLATSTYCPDGIGRWFYERAAGSYNVMLAREGTSPARLRQLKESIPTSRRITKTDLAKYQNAWSQKPDVVSHGAQKNFKEFMEEFEDKDAEIGPRLPSLASYKHMISKTILFKTAQRLIRPMFPAFQANIVAYLVSLVSFLVGERIDLDRIWQQQDLSQEFKRQLQTWAVEVNQVLHQSANGRMISEWAKKHECWETVRTATYTAIEPGIPEVN
jgi:hypothetical protein